MIVKGRSKQVTAKGGKRIKQQQRTLPGKKGRIVATVRKSPTGKSVVRGLKRSSNGGTRKGKILRRRKSESEDEEEEDEEDDDESSTG